MAYTMRKQVDGSFEEVVGRTTDALADEGFGVLCDIDVQTTFAEKLDEEFRQYRILGACNPELAFEGLAADVELGTLLPCNVVVYETDEGDVVVSAVDPATLIGIADDSVLDNVAADATEGFERVFEAL